MPRRLVTLLVIACFATFAFAFAGCGGDDESAAEETAITETTTTEETETTETETTETTETEETEDTDTTETSGDFASAENCEEFAQIGAQLSSAISGTADVDQIKETFDALAAAAPDDIRADFETLAEYMAAVAEALEGVDLTSPTPDPQALAKLQALDSAAATTASQNIGAWVQENCT